MKVTFLGATKTVTGSNFLVEGAGKKFIVDCGLYQGSAKEEIKNNEPFPFNIDSRQTRHVIYVQLCCQIVDIFKKLKQNGKIEKDCVEVRNFLCQYMMPKQLLNH